MRLQGFSFQQDFQTIIHELGLQTLNSQGYNGYNQNMTIVSLPTSYYYYNDYSGKKNMDNNEISYQDKNSILNDKLDIGIIDNKNDVQKRIENSHFQYHNWSNPDFDKNRLKNNESNESYIAKLNNEEKSYHYTNASNNLFNVLKLHHYSSIIKRRLLNKRNQENENENHFIPNNEKDHNLQNNKYTKDQSKLVPLNNINHNISRFSLPNKLRKYDNNTYDDEDEDEDDDSITDPDYSYCESTSDSEEEYSNIMELNSSIKATQSANQQIKDSLYHELYDIMQDPEIIESLKDQNFILDNESSQNLNIDNDYEEEEASGILTRSKYRNLFSSDAFSTATEGLSSSQTISEKEENSTSSMKYQLPLRDAIAKESAQQELDNKLNSHQAKVRWNTAILKKFNPFAHHDSTLESSSSSSGSSSNNNELSSTVSVSESTTKDPYEIYRRTCVVCFDAQREIILWPCGCLSLCDNCREMMTLKSYKRCPCCQQEVNSYSRLNLN